MLEVERWVQAERFRGWAFSGLRRTCTRWQGGLGGWTGRVGYSWIGTLGAGDGWIFSVGGKGGKAALTGSDGVSEGDTTLYNCSDTTARSSESAHLPTLLLFFLSTAARGSAAGHELASFFFVVQMSRQTWTASSIYLTDLCQLWPYRWTLSHAGSHSPFCTGFRGPMRHNSHHMAELMKWQ